MDPLFVNHMQLNKATLLEWYRVEFKRNHRVSTVLMYVLAVLFAVLAVLWIWVAIWQGSYPLWTMVVMYAVGALVMFAIPPLRHRLHVAFMLRQDKGHNWPQDVSTLFYPDAIVPLREEDGTPGDESAAISYGEEGLQLKNIQSDFGRMKQSISQLRGITGEEDESINLLQQQLEVLQQQVGQLKETSAYHRRRARYPYSNITGYLETENLYVIYYDALAVVAAKDGFVKGEAQQFEQFMYQQIQDAERAAQSEKIKRSLQNALHAYAPKKHSKWL